MDSYRLIKKSDCYFIYLNNHVLCKTLGRNEANKLLDIILMSFASSNLIEIEDEVKCFDALGNKLQSEYIINGVINDANN